MSLQLYITRSILSPQASHIAKMQIIRQMKARASKLSCFSSSIMILIIIIIASLGTKGLYTPMKAIIGLKEEEPVNCSHFIGVENKKVLNQFKSISLTKEQALIKLLFHENQMQKQIVTMDTIGGFFFNATGNHRTAVPQLHEWVVQVMEGNGYVILSIT